jgi:hypothetical protein
MRAKVIALGAVLAALGWTQGARADSAVVAVGFAQPPPGRTTYVYEQPPPPVAVDPSDEEGYRSPMRLHIGPVGATTGRGLGPGLGLAADFGRGTVGVRLAAAWVRGEPSASDPSPIGQGLSQYTGELTLDLHKRGPWHPVLGVGFGLARASRADSAGNLGIGTARLALEYALGIDDADVRFSAGIMGVLPGPADQQVQDVKGWALAGVSVGIGF